MKNYNITAIAISVLALVSCAGNTGIKGTVSGAADRDIVVKQLDMNVYSVLDTVRTGSDGAFKYSLDLKQGQPEFIYLFYGDTRVAALLLEKGEQAVVAADTLGNYSVGGSEGSAKLREVENAYAGFVRDIVAAGDDSAALGKIYLNHYRNSVKYVMTNPFSLTVIPVLYEQLNNMPVFGQETDALHFRSAADSLAKAYPDSRYVKALDKEAARREQILAFNTSIRNAPQLGYPDLNLPGLTGTRVSLSSLDSKVILLHFWDSSVAEQKMMNIETLLPVYKEFHDKGFEIYSVCVDTDKSRWAASVKAQNLPWINVNDGLGASSTAVSLYNVSVAPMSFLIADGEMVTEQIKGNDELRGLLRKLLK